MNNPTYFRLYADCKLTQGQTRASLVDYSRSKIYLISNGVAALLADFAERSYNAVMSDYDADDQKAIEDVLKFFLENELAFFTEHPERFPEVPEDFAHPAVISNAMIDIDADWHDMSIILPQLVELGCHDIQMRIFKAYDRERIEALVEEVSTYPIKSIELIIHYHRSLGKRFLRDLTERYFIIKNIFLHSSPKDEPYVIYPDRARNNMGNIVFVKQKITGAHHCGFISPRYFVYDNLSFFHESRKHNNCLHRKIGIDSSGHIKNCPALPIAFGHVNDTPLAEAVQDAEFKAYWDIHKGQIDTCKSCEFRNVCQDCRAFTEGNKLLGKPIKCGYDPYTGTWGSEKQQNLLIQKM